jgi:predicted kinase
LPFAESPGLDENFSNAMNLDLKNFLHNMPEPFEHGAHHQPRLTVVAGASGVGKSTFIQALALAKSHLGPCITADEIAGLAFRCTRHRTTDDACYRFNDSRREALIRSRTTFLTETTLSDSHDRRLRMIQLAKTMGYRISLVFLFSVDAEQILLRRLSRNAARDQMATIKQVQSQQDRAFKNLRAASKYANSVVEVEADSMDFSALRHSQPVPAY